MSSTDRTYKSDVLGRQEEIEAPPDPSRYTTLRRMLESKDYRVVLSLGGGSVPGLCGNCGLLSVLEDLDLRQFVTQIWGTSAGAVAGGGWATGASSREILHHVESLDRRGSVDVMWGRLVWSLLFRPFGRGLPDALVRGRHFHRAVAAGLRVSTFEECEIAFRCIACTDRARSERIVFSSGPLLPAISASMAMPGLLLPLQPDGSLGIGYYDGGLVEKTPLRSPIAEHMHSDDRRCLLLLGTHFRSETSAVEATRGFVNRFISTIDALESMVWSYQHEEASRRSEVTLLLLDPKIGDPQSFGFSRARRNFLHAREFFKDRLQNAKLTLALATP